MSAESTPSIAILGGKAGFVTSVNDPGLSIRIGGTVHNAWSSESCLARLRLSERAYSTSNLSAWHDGEAHKDAR